MMYEISQRFFFDSAHTLRRDIEAAGSRRVHGHTYYAEVFVRGEPQGQSGMVLDLGYVRREIEGLREKLDHHFLDEVAGLGIPTLENLCAFIWKELQPKVPGLSAVSVERQALGDKCVYRPPVRS
ncbi:MAG: 6-carboxytetrahydropterin synthase [Hylemonella sp.]|uniref:6-carboxytetrahydropterin synthase n=1 Tax=Hylemonella sp. TaxID=2066020 RepID=UPI00391ABD46